MDSLKDFLAECCTPAEGEKTLFKSAYGADRRWCESSGEYPMRKKTFKIALVELSYDCQAGKGKPKASSISHRRSNCPVR
jgi:phage/plasmid-associated DNA primase